MKPIVLPEASDSDPLEFLCRADERGLLIGPDESFAAFAGRLDRLRRELPENQPAGAPEVSASVREGAEEITEARYGFRADWLPAYYSTAETGRLSAGVSVILEDFLPLVYLSGAFRTRNCHHGYRAEETLAHESVHAARIAFPEASAYEEYFPCQVHASGFRRRAGNLFRRWWLAAIFLLGLTFAVLDPMLLVLPLLILLRELHLRRRIRNAGVRLRALGLRAEPVLLRLSDAEIGILASGGLPRCLAEESSLRRRLFFLRFALH
ncbi:MAG: hypothetical protein MR051_01880 [Lentisphaeria bacterium]|nr:hypothetical protein [Lentisphaeria bacterium]